MKRLFTHLMLLTALLLCSSSSWAETYKLKIAGIEVTDANKNNITGSGISGGSVVYDSANKILTLTNTTINASSSDGIYNQGIDGLYIACRGTVNISTSSSETSCAGIYANAKTTIGSSSSGAHIATVNISNTGVSNGIRSYGGAEIRFFRIKATVSSAQSDAAFAYTAASMMIYSSQVTFNGASGHYAVNGFTDGLSMDYAGGPLAVLEPNYSFDKSTGRIMNGSTAAQKATVYPAVTIGDEPLSYQTPTLISATTGATLVSGSAFYNSTTNKLRLSGGFTMKGAGINVRVPGLTVEVDGTATIENSNNGINIRCNTTFTGGTLKVTSTSESCFSTYNNADVTFKMTSVEALGKYCGFYGQTTSKLTLENTSKSVYKFAGETCNLLTGQLILNDMDIWTAGAYFNVNEHRMYRNGSIHKATSADLEYGVWFKSVDQFNYYGLTVAGTKVNGRNCEDIHSPYMTAGTASYVPGTNTLTLNNVQIDMTSTDEAVVKTSSGFGNFILKFTGSDDMYLKSKYSALDFSSNTTISGTDNRVYVTSTEGSGIITRSSLTAVTIDKPGYFGSVGKMYGYYGENTETLTLKKATSDSKGFRFEGESGAIYSIANLKLDNMDYGWEGNKGCYFGNGSVRQNGGNLAKGAVEFGSIKETLPIYVAGKQLNRVNSASTTIYVGSPYIKSGTQSVGYKPETKTLTLNNATIDYTAASSTNDGIIQTKANTELTITANGNNSLSSTTAYGGLWLDKSNVTINGNGTLSLAGCYDDLYGLNSTTLKVEGDVTLEALKNGIGSNNFMGEMIVGGNAVIKAKQISVLNALTLNDGQAIVEPAGATFANKRVEVGGSKAQNVVIMKVEKYGLYVCDVEVTSYNCADILGDGKFVYDASSKTLTINNASVNSTTISNVVSSNVSGLTINVFGDNTFKVVDNIFRVYATTTIKGSGSVTGELTAIDGFGIYAPNGGTLTLDGLTFSFKGKYAVGASTSDLIINSGKLIYTPNGDPSTKAFNVKSLTLGEGMMITEPAGATFNASAGGITVDGSSAYKGRVVIEGVTAYDLTIAGTTVNSANCNDILGNGVFSYDDATKTLTINGNFTYTDGNHVVESYVDGLTINVAGNSTIVSSSNSTMIYLCNNSTITGGKLTLMCTHPNNDGLGIYLSASSGEVLTIKDATIDITGSGFEWGITGSSLVELVIDNSDVTATAHNYGVIADWGGITLNGCYVDTPRPSIILSTGICDGGGNWVGSTEEASVVIKAGTDAIEGIDAAEAAPADVYDVAGRRLDQTRRGINIVRTKDGKTVKMLKK